MSDRLARAWETNPGVVVVCALEACPEIGTRVRVGSDEHGWPTLEWQDNFVSA